MNSKFKLVCLRNNKETIVDRPKMLVGRSDSCDVRVEEGNASREHARIIEKSDGLIIQDLHSTNGTFVNKNRVQEDVLLKPGEIVKFGEENFSLQWIENEATVVSTPVSEGSRRQASSLVEDDDEDSTVVFQAYQMPPGWSDFEGSAEMVSSDDSRKAQAIEVYVKKTRLAMRGQKGLVLFFFVEDEPPSIRSMLLQEGDQTWSFGRSSEMDFSFWHQSISELHAELKLENGQWVIEDSNSTNGLWLEKQQQSAITLQDGTRFYAGTVEILVRLINH